MSSLPLISTDTDDRMTRCTCTRLRRALQRYCCLQFLYRVCSNVDDMTFSRQERAFFDVMANRYNLAKLVFIDMKPDSETGTVCLGLYFQANFAVVQGNSKKGEQHVREGLEVAKSSQKCALYELLLASPLARVYQKNGDIDKLRHLLHKCFQMIDALGRRVPGSILGWLFYMRARAEIYDRPAAVADFERAINAFNTSENIDKEFGVAHAICRLIICMLGCGEEAHTIDLIDTPCPREKKRVQEHFHHLEDMAIVDQCVVIRIIYLMAKSDYAFRTRKRELALKHTKEAHQLAVNEDCEEFNEVTKQREAVYAKKYQGDYYLL